MGQARKRGTKEERVAQAQLAERLKPEEYRRAQAANRAEWQAKIDAMTEEREAYFREHRRKERRSPAMSALMGAALISAAGMGMGMPSFRTRRR